MQLVDTKIQLIWKKKRSTFTIIALQTITLMGSLMLNAIIAKLRDTCLKELKKSLKKNLKLLEEMFVKLKRT